MSVNAISSNNAYYPYTPAAQNNASPFQMINQDLTAIGNALQSGNISSAQQAVASIQNLISNPAPGSPGTGISQSGTTNPLSADLSALSSALQSRNMQSAQAAYTKLVQDIQSGRHGHHRHHHAAGNQNGSAGQSPNNSIPTTSNASITGGIGSGAAGINLIA